MVRRGRVGPRHRPALLVARRHATGAPSDPAEKSTHQSLPPPFLPWQWFPHNDVFLVSNSTPSRHCRGSDLCAAALGLPFVEHAGKILVRLEDFAWVLNGPALCEAITGQPWEEYEARLSSDPAAEARFTRQSQLASYFVGQLSLHSKMCFGRRSVHVATPWRVGSLRSMAGVGPRWPALRPRVQ